VKKTVFSLSLFLISNLLCREVSAQRFKAGISAGLVSSDVYGDDPRDYDNDFNKLGYVWGGLVNTHLSENDVLQLEINLIQKGTLQSPDSNGFGYYRLALNYVEMPLIYKHRIALRISKNPINAFDIIAGISAGQLYHSKIEGDFITVNPDMSFLNKTDVSIHLGIAYNFSNHFNFCIRYSNSIIPVFKQNIVSSFYYPTPFDKFNSRNNMVWHFIFEYTFGNS